MIKSAAEKQTEYNLNEGDKAPDFTAASSGHDGKTTLSSFKGKKVVLYFYPKDDTPGCTVEAKDFARLALEFDKAGVVVIGVSKDAIKSHDKFREKYCLPFTLVSDEDGKICEDYGVWVEKSMYGKKYMGIERSTFLVDESGKVSHIWRKVKVDGHAEEVLQIATK